MTRKRTYQTHPVHSLDASSLAKVLGGRCIVAIDIAKSKMVFGLAMAAGQCVELSRFEHPTQTRLFLTLLTSLRELGLAIEVVIEPTGVYGDALRHQLSMLKFPVFRVDAKKVHDAAELLDGVPSSHDAKACTILAHLHAQGLSKPWRERAAMEKELRSLVHERDLHAQPLERMYGQLEALVARYWPELSAELNQRSTWQLQLIGEMPGPAEVAADPDGAMDLLRRRTRGRLHMERRTEIVKNAHRSLGMPMDGAARDLLRALARHMLELRTRIKDVDKRIGAHLRKCVALKFMIEAFGSVTTAVVLAEAGNPSEYESTGAFEKALGLNLRIRQSGNNAGRGSIRITKRGPGRVRRYLFLAALRFIASNPIVKRWYQARKSFEAEVKLKAVVALMRKLARAMVHVARGQAFDASKLFETRRLQLEPSCP